MSTNSREKNFVKSTIILAFGTFLPKLASFITLPIYTACLTKEEYGTYDLITILCTLLLPVATLQIQSAVFRFLLDKRDNPKKVKSIITALYVFVIPISFIVLIILFFLLNSLSILIRIYIVLYYFADILLVVTRQIARGLSLNHKYSVSAVINSFLNMSLVIVFLLVFNKGLEGLIFSLMISATVSFIYLFTSMRCWKYIDLKILDKKIFIEMINYSWPMIPNSISLWVMRVSDRAIISWFMGVEANAIYAVANKIPTLLQLAQNTFSMSWSESASMTIHDNDADSYYSKMFRTLHRVLAGFAAVLMGFLPILFAILIRGSYEEAYIHIPILVIGMFYSSVSVYLGGIYLANMRTKSIGVTTILAAILNFVINILFIKKIGIYAASLSTAISYLFLMIYRMFDVRKFQKIHYSYGEIIATNFILIIMGFLCSQRTMLFYVINFVLGLTVCIRLNKELLMNILKMLVEKIKNNFGQ